MFIYFGGYIMSVAIASGEGPGDNHWNPLRNGPGLVFRLVVSGLEEAAPGAFADFKLIHERISHF